MIKGKIKQILRSDWVLGQPRGTYLCGLIWPKQVFNHEHLQSSYVTRM